MLPRYETDPREARGLEEVDRVIYPLRKFLKSKDYQYQFQSPSFSPSSSTLVCYDPLDTTIVRGFFEGIGMNGTPITKSIPVNDIDGLSMIVIYAHITRVNVHGEDRPAIRIAYELK